MQDNLTATVEQSKESQVKKVSKGKFIKLPVDFLSSQRCYALLADHGYEALGIFLRLIPILCEYDFYALERKHFKGVAYALGIPVEALERVIESLLEHRLLIEGDGLIFSPDLIEWRQEFDKKSEAALSRWQADDPEQLNKAEINFTQSLNKDLEKEGVTASISNSRSGSKSKKKREGAGGENTKPAPRNALEAWKPPPEKQKYADFVWMTEAEFEKARKFYEANGLGTDGLRRAIQHVDRNFRQNPKKRHQYTDDYRSVIGWPLKVVAEEFAALNRLTRSEQNFNGGAKK